MVGNTIDTYHYVVILFLAMMMACPIHMSAQQPEITWLQPADPEDWPDTLSWWKRNNLRTMQTNLPAYEAELNADSLVSDLVRFSVNCLIINGGGIMAFYPSKLPFQYINPYMQPDMLGDVIELCHANDIRVITRFDFSRVHESIFKQYPDWCYISPDGDRIINDDMYMASINAPYVQEKSIAIIQEVMERYPIDGIFINMPGYHTRNHYEDTYHGIDQNRYDQERFKSYSGGKQLPVLEDADNPVFREYQAFKTFTAHDWIRKVHEAVKAINPEVAICTYMDDYVDIIRHESQTRELPHWLYSASDNVSSTGLSHPGKIVSNASIQQISFRSRYNAIEPEETAIRLYENIANGSGLDMSLMGDFRNYEDERNFDIWEAIYAHHKRYEPYFGNYNSPAEICLIAPGYWPGGTQAQEYRGIQKMLKENHLQFDIIEAEELSVLEDRLEKYKLFILPDIMRLKEEDRTTLLRLCRAGRTILGTNRTLGDEPDQLAEVFGAYKDQFIEDSDGYYLVPKNKTLFQRFQKQTLVFNKFNMGLYQFEQVDHSYLPIYTPGIPGPPEKIGGHTATGYYGVGIKQHENGLAVLMPLNLGRLYYLYGYEQHKNLILDVINTMAPNLQDQVMTNAHKRVEVILQEFTANLPDRSDRPSDGMILHLVNLTGFSGNTYFNPLPIDNMSFRVRTGFKPANIQAMVREKSIPFHYQDGYVTFILDHFGQFEGLVMKR